MRPACPDHEPTSGNKKEKYFYRTSVRSLFILAIFDETLRSMVRSPISTTTPPTMSGFTYQGLAC